MEESKMHITTENVALPEIHFEDVPEENDEKVKDGDIDYDVAIPEVHIKEDK